jgi:hypothetical protein
MKLNRLPQRPANVVLIKGTAFYNYFFLIHEMNGARGGAVGRGTALQVGSSQVLFPIVSLKFFIDIILPAALWS